jgi:formate hydrogenlyase subunit 6/NADH:ubiquinone oxidoreductase subunit I
MENLSMSGETEIADYEEKDMNITLEDVIDQTKDIQEIIEKEIEIQIGIRSQSDSKISKAAEVDTKG